MLNHSVSPLRSSSQVPLEALSLEAHSAALGDERRETPRKRLVPCDAVGRSVRALALEVTVGGADSDTGDGRAKGLRFYFPSSQRPPVARGVRGRFLAGAETVPDSTEGAPRACGAGTGQAQAAWIPSSSHPSPCSRRGTCLRPAGAADPVGAVVCPTHTYPGASLRRLCPGLRGHRTQHRGVVTADLTAARRGPAVARADSHPGAPGGRSEISPHSTAPDLELRVSVFLELSSYYSRAPLVTDTAERGTTAPAIGRVCEVRTCAREPVRDVGSRPVSFFPASKSSASSPPYSCRCHSPSKLENKDQNTHPSQSDTPVVNVATETW